MPSWGYWRCGTACRNMVAMYSPSRAAMEAGAAWSEGLAQGIRDAEAGRPVRMSAATFAWLGEVARRSFPSLYEGDDGQDDAD